jgi:hypothetical protein
MVGRSVKMRSCNAMRANCIILKGSFLLAGEVWDIQIE